jgi:barstar (barnase inhibitor)
VAAFDPDADLSADIGFRLLSATPVTLFHRPDVLAETTTWLGEHQYQVTRFDAAGWSGEADLHRDVAAALGFPDHYGHNLDALNDCLYDVVGQVYGWAPDTAGLVLVFTGYDAFTARCPRAAQAVLDILADHSRCAALIGRRLLCLVRTDDPGVRFEPVGAAPVAWNEDEWFDPDAG